MKIIQIIDNSDCGGVNSFVYDLCLEMKRQDNDVCLIVLQGKSTEDTKQLENDNIPVYFLKASSKKDAILNHMLRLRKLLREISNGEETVCNLHLKLSVLMGAVASIGFKNICCIETYHNTYHHYWLQCTVLRPRIKKYICVSETAEKEMWHRFRTPRRKTVAIPNGVSRLQIQELSKNGLKNIEDKGTTRIVSVGRLSYEKNLLTSIAAMAELDADNISYTVIGTGPQEEEARRLADGHSNIRLTGALPRDKVIQELSKADIVLMPSLWEGRSILQLEAMALDKPLILSDVPGLREPFGDPPLEDGELYRVTKWGYLVRTTEKESYKAAIRHLLKNQERKVKLIPYIKKISAMNDMEITGRKYIEEFKKLTS